MGINIYFRKQVLNMNFDVKSLSIIESSKILKQEDLQQLSALSGELQDTFLNTQMFRTRTEMEASVLNDLKHPTADSKYWQSMREQNVMFHELVMLSYEYRKNQVEIKILERDITDESDELKRELLQIEIEKKQFIGINQERTAKDRIREIQEWHEIKESLVPLMECDTTDVNTHQLYGYTLRWINQLQGLSESASISERNNLLGQLQKGLRLCRERGIIDKVYKQFPDKLVAVLSGVEKN
jgi:hypothetical protein